MAKQKTPKEPRYLTCEETGKQFLYRGVGRPPRFCPEVAERKNKERRAKAQSDKRAAKKKSRADAATEALAA